ncbi:MAG: c-type cytochrome [Bacteroidetes bacterium]|nr:c-type cytochrome [Bacteroidota bacterium]
MAEYEDKLLDHDYDGIHELDNNLPRWWLYLFYFTIVWGVVYMLYYHVFDIGYSQVDQYRQEMDPNYVRVGSAEHRFLGVLPEYHSPYYSVRPEVTPARLLAMSGRPARPVMMTAATDTITYVRLTDEPDLKAGNEIFVKNCAQCHGDQGQGGIGPNLTDKYWIHGTDYGTIVRSVKYGYPAKGMIPWLGTLSEEQAMKVASFVYTLRGTNPPNPKPPQGDLIAE